MEKKMKRNSVNSAFLCLALLVAVTAVTTKESNAQLSQAFGAAPSQNRTQNRFDRSNQHPIVGPWSLTKQNGNQIIKVDFEFKRNGKVTSTVKISVGQDDNIEVNSGTWKIEGNHLIVDSDNEDDRDDLPFKIENGTLYIHIPETGQTLVMTRPGQQLRPTNQRPFRPSSESPREQRPNENRVDRQSDQRVHPLAGQWYFSGQNGSVSLAMKLDLRPDGSAKFDVVVRKQGKTQPVSTEGSWALEGTTLVLKSTLGTERIPCSMAHGQLILDFTNQYGIKISLSRQPGQSSFQKTGGENHRSGDNGQFGHGNQFQQFQPNSPNGYPNGVGR
jgi:hypothetical protein